MNDTTKEMSSASARPATMRAVIFKGVKEVAVEQRPTPTILDPKDVIVKVKATAICGSDLHFYRGHIKVPPGFIVGHEFTGIVDEVGGEVRGFRVGDEVVAPFTTACGDCFYCSRGQSSRCAKGLLFGNSASPSCIPGGQAEYVRVPYADTTLVLAPTNIPASLLVLMANIFPTGYFAASRFLKGLPPAEAASTVCAVIGCGPVGICAIASALTMCSTVYAIDDVPERIAEAEKIGAKPLLLSDDVDAAIKAATNGRGADLVLDAVGHASAMELTLKLVRPFGKIRGIGMYSDDLVLPGPVLYGKNVTCAWGRCPVRSLFEEALECLVRVQESVGFLCERSMGLEDAQEAFRLFDARKVHKVVLVP